MDKINTNNWGNTFRQVMVERIFTNDRYNEVSVSLHEPGLASARVTTIHTPGMDLIHANFTTERKLELVDPDNVESISSSYIVEGDMESKFNYNNKLVKHWQKTHGFQYTPDFNGKHTIHNNKLEAYSVVYNAEYFKSIANSSGMPFLDEVMNRMERRENLLVAPGQIALQPNMAEVLNHVAQCSFVGLTRYLYIEAKMLELFALQLEQLNSTNGDKDKWSIADKERLKAVHDYICKSYREPLTLSGLACKFGLNEFKLKKGYKRFFGTTVFGHIQKLRMEAARAMLVSGEMNVSEAADYIGYNNVSSFSEGFKKYFGYLPGSIRNVNQFKATA